MLLVIEHKFFPFKKKREQMCMAVNLETEILFMLLPINNVQQFLNLSKHVLYCSVCFMIMDFLLSHYSRENLENIPALANNPIRRQIIGAFFDKRNQHQNEVGSFEEIGFEQFLMVMSHFRPPTLKTTEEERETMRKEKLRFLFNMHDTDNDGTITLEEYRKAVEELLSKSGAIGQEGAKAIADAAMLEVASTNVPHMVRELTTTELLQESLTVAYLQKNNRSVYLFIISGPGRFL
uniref:Calcineurin B homologous protein 3 n=1 Tax=Lates calcarifer TaxID=8187 RepID=A0A4W6BNZ8_LATCA